MVMAKDIHGWSWKLAHPIRDWSCMYCGNNAQMYLPRKDPYHDGKFYDRRKYKNDRTNTKT